MEGSRAPELASLSEGPLQPETVLNRDGGGNVERSTQHGTVLRQNQALICGKRGNRLWFYLKHTCFQHVFNWSKPAVQKCFKINIPAPKTPDHSHSIISNARRLFE